MGSCSCDHANAIALKPQKFSFKKRKENLKKKTRELTTLCYAQACMIIFPPKQTQTTNHIWPEKLEDFNKVIERYNKTSNSNRKQQQEKEDTPAVIKKQMQQNNNCNNNKFNLQPHSKQQLEAILRNIDSNVETVKQKMNPIDPMSLLCSSEYDYVKQTMNPVDPMLLLCTAEYDYANQKMNPNGLMPLVCSTDYDGDYYYDYGNFYFSGFLGDSTAMGGASESLVNFMC